MTVSGATFGASGTGVDVGFLPYPPLQRRWTVLIRIVLLIPQWIVLGFVSIAAFVLGIVGWFGALFTGRLPDSVREFLQGWLRWTARVFAYGYLVTDRYPPFSMGEERGYPVAVEIRGSRLNRWAVFFRLVVVLPVYVLSSLATAGLGVVLIVYWLITLVAGRMPTTAYLTVRATLRFYLRCAGYLWMLTSRYPGGLFGDPAGSSGPEQWAAPAPPPGAPWPPPIPAAPPWAPPSAPGSGAPIWPSTGPSTWPSPAPTGAAGTSWPAPGASPSWPPAGPSPAWPPSAAPPAAPPDLSWRFSLTTGANWLVVLFLVLGALTYARNAAAISSVFGGSTASSQLTSAYNTLAVDEHSFVSATQSCLSSSDTLTCVETADDTVADELSSFADSVSNISFPASASSQAAALVATTRTAVSDMRQVASAPDAATYQQLATSSGLQQSLSRVDTDYSALVNALA